MGKLSREKGKVGEREVAKLIRDFGFEAQRGQQFRGGGDSPDIIHNMRDLKPAGHNLFVEVKFREKLNLYETMEQAEKEMGAADMPVIFHRKNRKPWLVTLRVEDFLDIIYCMHNAEDI